MVERIAQAIYEARFLIVGFGEYEWPECWRFGGGGPWVADDYRDIARDIVHKHLQARP